MGHLARYPTRNVQNSLQAFLKLPIQAGKRPGSLETFQSFWKLSSLNFLYCILYFVWHFSTPGKNFLVVHNNSWGKMVNWAQFFFSLSKPLFLLHWGKGGSPHVTWVMYSSDLNRAVPTRKCTQCTFNALTYPKPCLTRRRAFRPIIAPQTIMKQLKLPEQS